MVENETWGRGWIRWGSGRRIGGGSYRMENGFRVRGRCKGWMREQRRGPAELGGRAWGNADAKTGCWGGVALETRDRNERAPCSIPSRVQGALDFHVKGVSQHQAASKMSWGVISVASDRRDR